MVSCDGLDLPKKIRKRCLACHDDVKFPLVHIAKENKNKNKNASQGKANITTTHLQLEQKLPRVKMMARRVKDPLEEVLARACLVEALEVVCWEEDQKTHHLTAQVEEEEACLVVALAEGDQ